MIELIVLSIMCLSVLAFLAAADIRKEQDIRREREAWAIERQQLLDRIQAPSFAEYKQQEVKVIKAQSGDKEPPKLDPL